MTSRPPAAAADRSAESLEDLLGLMPLAAVVVGEDGAILLANDLLAELLGWERAALTGEPLETLIPERFHAAHAKHFGRYLEAPEVRPLNAGDELWARHKDGSELPVDIHLRPVTLDGSTVVIASLRDLSRQRRVAEELSLSERRYRIAASHTADLIQEIDLVADQMTFLGDVDGLFGYAPGEFPRTVSGWLDLVHPDDQKPIEAEVEQALSSRFETWNWRYRMRAGDGTWRHIVDQGTYVEFLEDGRPIRAVGAVQDVTEQVEREQALREALGDLEVARDQLAEQNVYLREELGATLAYDEIIGDSEPWRYVVEQLGVVGNTEATVLLTGETGTGKEVLARALHATSARSDQPLIKVNCAALPSTLVESELFGHEKGAFSGADRRRKGRFELADRGTLLLDEVGELPLELQAKLLRVLQNGAFERLGSEQTLRSDVRIIAATNRDLGAEIEAGRFREDLYYRLAVFPIEVPPLRRRPEDIRPLALYFLEKDNAKHGKSIEAIPRAAMTAMEEYDWPGNVRELENVIERAVILSGGSTLALDPATLRGRPASSRWRSRRPAATPGPSAPAGRVASASLEEFERAHIVGVLESCGWKVRGRGNAAEQLGLNESTLRSRMKRLGIKRP